MSKERSRVQFSGQLPNGALSTAKPPNCWEVRRGVVNVESEFVKVVDFVTPRATNEAQTGDESLRKEVEDAGSDL